MADKLQQLVDKLRADLGERLQSVILYGSGASGEADPGFSDLNILCILTQVGISEMAAAEATVKWWHGAGNPSPLLLSEEEVRSSTDSFPIEFHDMQERRRVLFGADLIAGLTVRDSYYRAQVEHELRAKLLRLRQKGATCLSDKPRLVRLMLDSVSTFIVLARHVLLLSGVRAGTAKREIVSQLTRLEIDSQPLALLLDVREGKAKELPPDAVQFFGLYLKQVEMLATCVDRLGNKEDR